MAAAIAEGTVVVAGVGDAAVGVIAAGVHKAVPVAEICRLQNTLRRKVNPAAMTIVAASATATTIAARKASAVLALPRPKRKRQFFFPANRSQNTAANRRSLRCLLQSLNPTKNLQPRKKAPRALLRAFRPALPLPQFLAVSPVGCRGGSWPRLVPNPKLLLLKQPGEPKLLLHKRHTSPSTTSTRTG